MGIEVALDPTPNGPDLGYDFGFKIDNIDGPFNGVYSDGVLTVTITNSTNTTFSWSSSIGVDAVIVKGGPNANVYVYDPPAESTGDDGLTT